MCGETLRIPSLHLPTLLRHCKLDQVPAWGLTFAPLLRSLVEPHWAVVGAPQAGSVGAFRSPAALGHGCPARSFPRSAASLRWSPAYALSSGLISEPGASSRASGGRSAPANYPPFRLPHLHPGHVVNGETGIPPSHPDLIARSGRDGVTALPSLRQLVSLLRLHPGLRPGDAAARLLPCGGSKKRDVAVLVLAT